MFTEDDIVYEVPYRPTLTKGKILYNQGRVLDLRARQVRNTHFIVLEATVLGSNFNEYRTSITIDPQNGYFLEHSCTCPAHDSYLGICKHCVALAYAYLNSSKQAHEYTDYRLLDIVKSFAKKNHLQNQEACGNIELIPELVDLHSFYGTEYSLTFKIGEEDGRKYVIKNLETFLSNVSNETNYTYGKQLAFVHSKYMFTAKSWSYVQLIMKAAELLRPQYISLAKELPLKGILWDHFFPIVCGETLPIKSDNTKEDVIAFSEEHPSLSLCLERNESGSYRLTIPAAEYFNGMKYFYVRKDNTIYRYDREADAVLDTFIQHANRLHSTFFTIAPKDMPAFCGSVIPELYKNKLLETNGLDLTEYQPKEVQVSYYLDDENGYTTLKTIGTYGDKVYNLLDTPNLSLEYRDRTKELRAVALGRSYFPNENTYEKLLYFPSDDQDLTYHLLNTGLSQLEQEGTIFVSDSIKSKRIVRPSKTTVGVSIESGLLKLTVRNHTFSPEELSGVLSSYKKRKKFHRMKNGDFLPLEDNSLATVSELMEGLGVSEKEIEDGTTVVPRFRALYIDQMLKQKSEDLQVERTADYRSIIRNMKNIEDSDYSVPRSLNQILRDYQKLGFRWLCTLADLGFGGILADDMGLGKTLQMISYLLYRKQSGLTSLPHLIICPASLVYNWEHEIKQFAPELSVQLILGNAEQRKALIQDSQDKDIWITSYDLLKRDISSYKSCRFDTEIIDEAQAIKNQGTQAAKAVKKISSDLRFALTGTPIENRLSELWSIFDYLMPGILRSYDKFRKEYELPIIQNKDSALMERLRKMVSPFILRRVKTDVLKELPDKLEQIVYSKMEAEQRKIYEAHALRLIQSLNKQSAEEIQKGKIEILAELTKLRQICCSPKLLYEDYKNIACKVDTCLELVNQAIEGKHKTLIFSQFTSIFPLLEEYFRQLKIPYYKLTGQTSKEERMKLVEQFNSDEVPVFLISLKAGGTGLNLTAASIVIHLDPWWNIAAQNQATDRAHRIGQTEQVVVYKLIAQNTIEEKIIKLQEKKQELASQLLEGESVVTSALTKEDFMSILEF